MKIVLTESEMKTLKFYLKQALNDAEGMAAIGVGSKRTVLDLKSIIKKITQ